MPTSISNGESGLSVRTKLNAIWTSLVTDGLTVNGAFTSNGDTNTFASGNANDPVLIVKNTANDSTSTRLHFVKDGGRNGANGDDLAEIDFIGDNAAQEQTTFGRIEAIIASAADGAEGGKIRMRVATHDGEMQTGFEIIDGSADDEIDVNIGFGAASVTTVAGTLGVTGVVTANAGVVVDNITIDGNTISTTDTNGHLVLAPNGTGNVQVNSDNLTVTGVADETASLGLQADAASENPDLWKFTSNTANTLTIANQISGSSVSHVTITPNATVANSTVDLIGHVNVGHDLDVAGNVGIGSAPSATIRNDGASTEKALQIGSRAMLFTDSGVTTDLQNNSHFDNADNRVAMANDLGSVYRQYQGIHTFLNAASVSAGATQEMIERFRIAADGSLSTPTLGTSNVRFGVNAGNSILNGGDYNTVVGDEAGTAVTIGIRNTLIGALAGDALTDADYNVALGMHSLGTDTLGSKSTAIGTDALATQNFTTATESFNTAVGYQAGAGVTTGVQNTLVGAKAGAALTGGGFSGDTRQEGADTNVAVGVSALGGDTKGNSSVAIGSAALRLQNFTSATDVYNVAIGRAAGENNLTGTGSTFIGGLAGKGISGAKLTGNSNTAIGKDAGLLLQGTANSNTLIGAQAGDNITTGDSNIIIGSGIDPASATADNQLNIGGWITGAAGAITIANGLTLTNGNLVVADGHGIDFSAADSGLSGSSSNLLDDYEEGTWTATLTSASAPTTPPTTTALYTKIGRLVTISLFFESVNTSGGSGAMFISGLPFAAGSATGNRGSGSVQVYGLTFAGEYMVSEAAGSAINFRGIASNAAWTDLTITAGTGKYLQTTLTYTTA